MTIRLGLLAVVCFALVLGLVGCPAQPEKQTPSQTERPGAEKAAIKLATTTSVDNSGLLRHILPAFTGKSGIEVDVIAVGTGRALELGRAGDVDIILVHAPAAEEEFIAGGYGVGRHHVAQNEFVIVGPQDDPADVKLMSSAAEAFSNIMGAEATFVSRGDDSGTHKRELQVWEAMGVTPEGEWYVEAGQGMGAVLTMAGEMQAYTLTDTGTFYSMEENLDLVILFSGDPVLDNIYSIIPLSPERHPDLRHREAMELVDWITGPEGRGLISEYEVNGHVPFRVESEG